MNLICVRDYSQDPVVYPREIPQNMVDGWRCYIGVLNESCHMAPIYVNLYLVVNILYNILIILILKHGSATIFFMAMTISVPLGDIAFSFKFMPNHEPMTVYDWIGLVVLIHGLVLYRFWEQIQRAVIAIIKPRGGEGQPLLA